MRHVHTLCAVLTETEDAYRAEPWGGYIVWTSSPDRRYFHCHDFAVSTVTGAFIALSPRGRATSMLDPGELA